MGIGLSPLGAVGDVAASGDLEGAFLLILVSFIAPVLLVLAGVLFEGFMGGLRWDTGSLGSLGGGGFAAYAQLNLVGSLLVILPFLAFPVVLTIRFAAFLLALLVIVGVGILLLAAPILGAIVFGRMMFYGRRLGTLQPGSRHALTEPAKGPWTPGIGSVPTPLGSALGLEALSLEWPPAPPPQRGPPEGWIQCLRREIGVLEEAFREERESLVELDREMREGRIENDLYWARRGMRQERLAELWSRLSEARRMLSSPQGEGETP